MAEAITEKRSEVARMDGTQRAAVLLMSLGEQEGAQVLKHLSAKDVQKLGVAMATIDSVSRDQAEAVMSEFASAIEQQTSLGLGNDDYVRKVMISALGEDKASGIIDRILLGRNTKGIEALKWMETRTVAEMIRNEHPQIIAIVLAYLESDQASQILMQLPERIRSDVVMRIATLEGIQPSALQELDEIMEKQFSGGNNMKSSNVGGVKVAAGILNLLDSADESALMTGIRDIDQDLGARIQDLMFVFDDLLKVDDRSLQVLLREVSGEVIAVALKGADVKIQDKFIANMSRRAGDMMRDDMEAKGPVKLSEVEAAQKEILAQARRLADEGHISLGGKGDSVV